MSTVYQLALLGGKGLASLVNNQSYYMASSASGQDEPNCAMWLATWEGDRQNTDPQYMDYPKGLP